jgi:signal transduction histidine kinase/DNA-binding response OmpR family regulator
MLQRYALPGSDFTRPADRSIGNMMRVLVIEDSQVDFLLIERALGDRFSLQHATTLAAGLQLGASREFDLVILDLTLDDSAGYATFDNAHHRLPDVPIIVLSGLHDEELALRAVSNGAQDYILKSRLLDYPLDRAARYAIERRRGELAVSRTEQQYRALVDTLPVATFTCDAQGLITNFNQKAVELWGRTPRLNDPADRFSGAYRIFNADGTPISHNESWMARCLLEQKGFNGRELIIETPSHDRRVVLVHVNPVFAHHGAHTGAVAVLIDITSQRNAERELRESERFARSVVNSLSSHVAVLDENGLILAVNSAWRNFAEKNGMANADCGIGSNYLATSELAAGDCAGDGRLASNGIRAVLSGQQRDFYLEYPCHSPEEERWFALYVTPFEGVGSRRVVVTHENVTARKTAERLASEQCGLREAVAGMEQVLGVVGHELRTPLAALRAISEFLLTDGAKSTEEADHFLLEMSQEVDRMSDTVNNLLEAARLNSGRAKWNWSAIDLAQTADDAIASIQPLVDQTKVEILNQINPIANSMLGDADAVRRLLLNLLSNARKHTVDGQIEVGAHKHVDLDGSWIELFVRDTGPGIPVELLARLGEPFALNSGVVGKNYVGGTGLGLAICKGIAAAHGGEIVIDSVIGEGTTVTALLRADLQAAATGDTVSLASNDAAAA